MVHFSSDQPHALWYVWLALAMVQVSLPYRLLGSSAMLGLTLPQCV